MNLARHFRWYIQLAIASLLVGGVVSAETVEHPGVVPNDAECASCHVAKITGKSVHSAMASSCTMCHVTMTRGDMTTMGLSMPKTQICFACHQESTALRQHVPAVKGQCVECHDAHSSERKMLLLASLPGSSAAKKK